MAIKMNHHDPLRTLPLFDGCSPGQLAQARSLLTQLTVAPGATIISEGSFGYEFVIIVDGQAEVSTTTAGDRRELAVLSAGDFAGEMSLLRHDRRSATVVALTTLTIYVCNTAEFSGLLEVAPVVAERVTRAAAERSAANQRLVAA
jgi:CRP/FNR family cyclic AMP-dependent transcriptional regulator